MYFVSLLLKLRVTDDAIPTTLDERRSITLALTRFLCQADVSLNEKQITAAILEWKRQTILARLTIAATKAEMPTKILRHIVSQSSLQLDTHNLEVDAIDLIDPLWAGVSTWADILSEKTGHFIRFTLATPLITAEPGDSQGHGALPFPEPQHLFSHLLNHWQELDGPLLVPDAIGLVEASGCRISDYHLYTVSVEAKERPVFGYRGWFECESRTRDTTCLALLNALARLAFFMGIGYLTKQGMGVTAIAIS